MSSSSHHQDTESKIATTQDFIKLAGSKRKLEGEGCTSNGALKYSLALERILTFPRVQPTHNINDKSSNVTKGDTGSTDIDTFFRKTWQRYSQLYKNNNNNQQSSKSISQNNENPLDTALAMGWNGFVSMMHNSRVLINNKEGDTNDSDIPPPLIFRNQQPLVLDEIHETYNNNPFAAYLDGCSIVQNHADLLCPTLAKLALDLQKSFPHVYINTYLTPPKQSAVKAHADDRDVFVLQLEGEKEWKVYSNPPILYPYPHEQVGKAPHLPVPSNTIQSTPLFQTTLQKGDVLYMPRGFVHEARTNSDVPSLHATIAIATHDWSLSCTLSQMMRNHLDQIPEFRMAISPQIGTRELEQVSIREKDMLRDGLDRALQLMKDSVTVDSVAEFLGTKYEKHNSGAKLMRNLYTQRCTVNSDGTTSDISIERAAGCISPLVGPKAGFNLCMNTKIRASTQDERDSVPSPSSGSRGLTVRDDYDISSCLISILSSLKKDPSASCRIKNFRLLMTDNEWSSMVCDLTLYSFAQCCVELGAMSVVTY